MRVGKLSFFYTHLIFISRNLVLSGAVTFAGATSAFNYNCHVFLQRERDGSSVRVRERDD